MTKKTVFMLLLPILFTLLLYDLTNSTIDNFDIVPTYQITDVEYITTNDLGLLNNNFDNIRSWEPINIQHAKLRNNNERYVIYKFTTPPNLNDKQQIAFYTNNQIYDFYIDDVKVSSLGNLYDTKRFPDIYGRNFDVIPLSTQYANKDVYIVMRSFSSLTAGSISTLDITPTYTDTLSLLMGSIDGITIALFLISISISMYLFKNVISSKNRNKSVYISTFFIAFSITMCINLPFINFMFSHERFLNILTFLCNTAMTWAAILYLRTLSTHSLFKRQLLLLSIIFITASFFLLSFMYSEKAAVISISYLSIFGSLLCILFASILFAYGVIIYIHSHEQRVLRLTTLILFLLYLFISLFLSPYFEIFSLSQPYIYGVLICLVLYMNYILVNESLSKGLYVKTSNAEIKYEQKMINAISNTFNQIADDKYLDQLAYNVQDSIRSMFDEEVVLLIASYTPTTKTHILYQEGTYKKLSYVEINRRVVNVINRYISSPHMCIFEGNKCTLFIQNSVSNYFIVKINKPEKSTYTDSEKEILQIYLLGLANAYDNTSMFQSIMSTQTSTLLSIGRVIDERMYNHTNCVIIGKICKVIALDLNFSIDQANELRNISYIANIGLISVSDDVIQKIVNNSTALIGLEDSDEYMQHTTIGYNMLSKSGDALTNKAADLALYHHEHFDGTGRLNAKKFEISTYTKIYRVAAEFDYYYNLFKNDEDFSTYKCFRYMEGLSSTLLDPLIVNSLLRNEDTITKIIATNNL